MKPFFWNKINNPNGTATVWNDLPVDVQVDFSDLESTFVIDTAASAPSQLLSPKKQNVTTLLDITRANNIAIMLSRIKLDYPQIRRTILEIDDAKLSVDDLKAIAKQLPTPDEIERIKSFDDVSKLAKADQYFYQIMSIPRLSERLECMQYRRKLDLDIEEIRPDLNIVRNACQELRSSLKFKSTLHVVLMLGNTLNGATFRGNARGFQLDSLLKMKETKTAKGGPECPTLLHYLARVLLRKDPSMVNFIEDLPSLEAAARVSVQTVTQSVNALVAGLDKVKAEVEEHRRLQSTHQDRFVQVMQLFIHEKLSTVDALKNMGQTVERDIRSLLTYFGENPDSPEAPKPEDFFGLIASFSSSLQKCALEVHDVEMQAKRTTSIKLTVEEPAEETPEVTVKGVSSNGAAGQIAKESQGRAAGNRSVGRGDLDQAIRSMREGKRRNRPTRPLSKIFLDGAAPSGRPQSRLFD
ncbi:hypothetical protein CVT26_006195 [Gymnopilus dilepis]|uniref:FH2 domain-containing protein n=1 Tax=Gymnopilus dilepis TaxID=231916 RepID=A0A409VPW6_9AGAR|nr:hypothetical protein CVT26_006195 [Gymnopilus dilepis]